LRDLESLLLEQGVEISLHAELFYAGTIYVETPAGGARTEIYQGMGVSASSYAYLRGEAPMLAHEIAVSEVTLEYIGADIGDYVYILIGEESHQYLITGSFHLLNFFGRGIRFSENVVLAEDTPITTLAIGGQFVNRENIANQVEHLEGILSNYDILVAADVIEVVFGDTAEMIEGVRLIVLIVVIAVVFLISVLMGISFFAKDLSQIAMLKSLGFRDGSIKFWQSTRIVVSLLVSIVLGILLVYPANVLARIPFSIMGAAQMEININVIEVYAGFPLMLIIATCIALLFTTVGVKKIGLRDLRNND